MAPRDAGAEVEVADLNSLIDALPKVELHVHIEGTLEAAMVFDLAKRNNVQLSYASVDELQSAYDFKDLQSFLDIYYQGCNVLLTEGDFYDITMAYLTRAHADGVVHAEIFFDPQSHTDRGVPFDTVANALIQALEDAENKFGMIELSLIPNFLRHLDAKSAMDSLNQILAYMEKEPARRHRIVGVGLDSSELGNPPSKFISVFEKVRAAGLKVCVHAGEEGPPSYIVDGLDKLGAHRIDHGIRCLEDPVLVNRLVKEKTPLTVCPHSNVRLCVFETMEEHTLKKMLDAGLCASIHSDDPAYFGGYISDNYRSVVKALRLEATDVVKMAENGIDSAWLSTESKDELRRRLHTAAEPYSIVT
jgi:adenosine deaminase